MARRPSQSAKNETSGPVEAFLEHERVAGGAELPLFHRRGDRRVGGRSASAATTTPLPGREAVGLDHDRESRARRRSSTARASAAVVHTAVAGGRNAVPRHEVLRERPCCIRAARPRGSGPKIRSPRDEKRFDDAAIERQLRTDDGQIDRLRAAPGRAGRRHRRRRPETVRTSRRNPGIARRADHLD